jgi:hypothetical protein
MREKETLKVFSKNPIDRKQSIKEKKVQMLKPVNELLPGTGIKPEQAPNHQIFILAINIDTVMVLLMMQAAPHI